jgi:glyoxylase-like metal-dependent hydrolase (beta-lactamase superfamily II)
MDNVESIAPDVWRITLPLPFRLREIHLYLARGERGYALVDAGIDTPESRETFDRSLNAIGVRHDEIRDVFVTHMHPDHIGMSGRHAAAGAAIHIMTGEERRARYVWSGRPLDAWVDFLRLHGLGEESASSVTEAAAKLRGSVRLPERFDYVEEGDTVSFGDRSVRVLWTPGHSDFHYVLVEDANKAIFTGDHLLPTITPNIGLYPECRPDPLADYLASFSKFDGMAEYAVYPGHGAPYAALPKRIGELREHHRERLDGVMARAADAGRGGASSAEIVGHFWGSRLNAHETRFALVEVAAHLEHLRRRGDLTASPVDGVLRYAHADRGPQP